MRLTLIRHGQTPSNVAGLLDTGIPGPGLTDLGRRQAAAVVPALADHDVDAIFASTLVRTQQTAAPLAAERALRVNVLDGLREVMAGDLEMAGDVDSARRYIGTFLDWFAGDLASRIPGGPNGLEVLARFDAAIAEIARAVGEAGSAVVFSHGAVIRVWAGLRAGDVDLGAKHLVNTGAVVLDGVVDDAADTTPGAREPVAAGGSVTGGPDADLVASPAAKWQVVSWGEGPIGDVPAPGFGTR